MPAQPHRRSGRGDAGDERRDVGRRGADAVHPGVDLDVDVDAVAAPPAHASASTASGVVTVGVSPWATIVAACSGGCSLSTRIGAAIPAWRSATPSAVRATQSPSQPASRAAAPTATAPCP